jgi:hypothetical protein
MPGPFRRPAPADELQPLGIVRQIHIDRELNEIRLHRPRTDIQRAAMDVLLDRRNAVRTGGEGGSRVTAPYSPGGTS